MMPGFLVPILLLASLLLPAGVAFSAASARSPGSPKPAPSCGVMLDSLEALEAEENAAFLAWDLEAFGCSPGQLYRGYSRQGVALAMVESWEAAAHALSLAKAIGGPDDEEILFHLWTALRRLDRRPAMVAAAKELYARFPASPYLALVLEDWSRDAGTRTAVRPWKASFESRFARSKVGLLDNVQSNRLKLETGQGRGAHAFREYASLSLKSRLGGNLLDAFQADLGAEWRHRGFSLEAGWGLGYDARNAGDTLVAALSGSGSGARWSGWNGRMAQASATWTGEPGEGPVLAVRADTRILSRNWWAAGASLSPTWFTGDWTVAGLLDWHEHATRWEFSETETLESGEPVEITYVMDGMRTLQASLTPGWRAGSHDLSLGLGYFMVRTRSRFRIGIGGAVDEQPGTSWEHSMALSPEWRYAFRKRLRLNLGMSLGYDFDEKTGASTPACAGWLPGYCADESYSADAGISISF